MIALANLYAQALRVDRVCELGEFFSTAIIRVGELFMHACYPIGGSELSELRGLSPLSHF